MATVNLGRIGFVNQGTYDAGTAYQVGDVVEYLNSVYACRVSGTGNPLTDANYWTVWVDSDFLAPLASPALTGTPTAPTAVSGTNTTQLATTEFVSLSSSLRRASIPMSKVLSGVLSLSNVIKTLSFDAVTYTGNGTTQNIVTGISSVDFTVASNGSGYWLDRSVNQVKTDAGVVQASGSCVVNTSKVHIKSRSAAYGNYNVDGLRGRSKHIFTNLTNAEAYDNDLLTAFNSDGISLGADTGMNTNLATYIAYQTLYTHIKWGVTSQGKFQIEAYNPVTNEGMIYYIGSGTAGHQISHSQGVEIDYVEGKGLEVVQNWSSVSGDYNMYLNLTNANDSVDIINLDSNLYIDIVTSTSFMNTLDKEHIMYYKCKSETFTIGTYTGTGVAGNFVETKDVNGVARRPARIIIKRIDAVGNWRVLDGSRWNFDATIKLNVSDAEAVFDAIDVAVNGFTFIDYSNIDFNTLNVTYLYLVEFDTDSTGTTGSYFDMATDKTNLQIADGLVSISSGYDVNGAINKIISKTGTITPTGGYV